jgi:hypothetical protein
MKKLSFVLIFISLVAFNENIFADTLSGKYELESSKVDYLVKYLIKKADGASTKSKGQGECKDKTCEFLVAAPIKSFESKDSNRDLNMLKTTNADKYPLVVVRVKADSEVKNAKIIADLEVEFAGVKKTYPKISFDYKSTSVGFEIEGKFDLILDQHKVEKPSLLGVNIENLVPIAVHANWKKQ